MEGWDGRMERKMAEDESKGMEWRKGWKEGREGKDRRNYVGRRKDLFFYLARYVSSNLLKYYELDFLRSGTLRYVTLRYVTLRYVTVRYVTLRYGTVRSVTLRYVTVRSVTV